MCSTKSADLIGHIKFVLWGQLDGYRVTRTFLSVKGVACKTNQLLGVNFQKVITSCENPLSIPLWKFLLDSLSVANKFDSQL